MPFKLSNVGEIEKLLRQVGVKVDAILFQNDVESMLTDYNFDYAYLIGFKYPPAKATVNEWNIDTENGVATAGDLVELTDVFTNPDFETGDFSGWDTSSEGSAAIESPPAPFYTAHGNYCAKLFDTPMAYNDSISNYVNQTITTDKGMIVKFGYYFYVYNQSTNQGDMSVAREGSFFILPGTHTIKVEGHAYNGHDGDTLTINVYVDNELVFTDSENDPSPGLNPVTRIYVDYFRAYQVPLLHLQNLDTNPIDAIYIATTPDSGSDIIFYATDGTNRVQLPANAIQQVDLNKLDIEAWFNPFSSLQLDNLAILWRRKV